MASTQQDRITATPPSAVLQATDFGVDWTGSTDSTAALQAAINAAAAQVYGGVGGGTIQLPPGIVNLAGTIKITTSGITLQGAGKGATVLQFNNAGQDCIVIQGTASSYLLGVTLRDFQITHPGTTGGR